MARPRRKPEPGDVYLTPLADGRLGACRVLRLEDTSGRKTHHRPNALVVACKWIGTEPPALADPALRERLVCTHHKCDGTAHRQWVDGLPPKEFTKLGNVGATAEELAEECNVWGDWVSMPHESLAQWRWDHDREALLREEAEEAAALEQHAAAEAARATPRPAPTLAELRARNWFGGWKSYVSNAQLRAVRKLFREMIDGLAALGPKPRPAAATGLIQKCVEGLNELDATDEPFIMTIEREDLCEAIDEVAEACGLEEGLADEWRDW